MCAVGLGPNAVARLGLRDRGHVGGVSEAARAVLAHGSRRLRVATWSCGPSWLTPTSDDRNKYTYHPDTASHGAASRHVTVCSARYKERRFSLLSGDWKTAFKHHLHRIQAYH